jgi:hypothetical protein
MSETSYGIGLFLIFVATFCVRNKNPLMLDVGLALWLSLIGVGSNTGNAVDPVKSRAVPVPLPCTPIFTRQSLRKCY